MGTHTVEPGECLSGIAALYNHLPETIWHHSKNASLRSSRKKQDLLFPGDVIYVPELEAAWERCATESRHRFRRKFSLGLVVRLEIDPEDPATADDRFVLASTDGSYSSTKTVNDDQIAGDEFLDLHYSGLKPNFRYALRAFAAEDSDPDVIFEDVPYEELILVSGAIEDDEEEEDEPRDDGNPDQPLADEPDEADAALG